MKNEGSNPLVPHTRQIGRYPNIRMGLCYDCRAEYCIEGDSSCIVLAGKSDKLVNLRLMVIDPNDPIRTVFVLHYHRLEVEKIEWGRSVLSN